ncbi:MAG: MBL fold metallo-hydrolase [Chitinophagaceae bacterium]|nr:MBL fold metallo-hydrolase [Chitinophagaceae bacterium]
MKYLFTITFLLSIHSLFGQSGTSFVDSVEQTIENTKEEIIKIKESYYVIQPMGIAGNVGVYIGPQEVILVDDQWAKLVPRIKELISSITDKPIWYVINTHYHFDHIDGNKAFGSEKVSIIAQENLRKRLLKDQIITGSSFGQILQRAYPLEALPSIVFKDSLYLHDEKETIRILHFPNAHSDGDAIVHFQKADIYHTGDIFVTYGLPVLYENNGGDIYSMIKTIDYLLSVSNNHTRFIPGHGPVSNKEQLAAYSKLLTTIKDEVVSLIKKGLAIEKIIELVKIDENIGGVDKKLFITHVFRMALKHENINSK